MVARVVERIGGEPALDSVERRLSNEGFGVYGYQSGRLWMRLSMPRISRNSDGISRRTPAAQHWLASSIMLLDCANSNDPAQQAQDCAWNPNRHFPESSASVD